MLVDLADLVCDERLGEAPGDLARRRSAGGRRRRPGEAAGLAAAVVVALAFGVATKSGGTPGKLAAGSPRLGHQRRGSGSRGSRGGRRLVASPRSRRAAVARAERRRDARVATAVRVPVP